MSNYCSDPTRLTNPDVTRGWWAEARWHPDFLCVITQSGYRSGQHVDEKGSELYLTPDASDEHLGQAVLNALSLSRWVLSKPTPDHIYHPDVQFDAETSSFRNAALREQEWNKRTRQLYGLKSKKDIYVPMKRCDIARKDGEIVMKCRVHYPESQHGNCWGFDTNEHAPYVILTGVTSPAEIGTALKLAFSRCRDLPG